MPSPRTPGRTPRPAPRATSDPAPDPADHPVRAGLGQGDHVIAPPFFGAYAGPGQMIQPVRGASGRRVGSAWRASLRP